MQKISFTAAGGRLTIIGRENPPIPSMVKVSRPDDPNYVKPEVAVDPRPTISQRNQTPPKNNTWNA